MTVEELNVILEYLLRNPILVSSFEENKIVSELGTFELECDGNCVHTTFHNNLKAITVLGEHSEKVKEIFKDLKLTGEQFAMNLIKYKMINFAKESTNGD